MSKTYADRGYKCGINAALALFGEEPIETADTGLALLATYARELNHYRSLRDLQVDQKSKDAKAKIDDLKQKSTEAMRSGKVVAAVKLYNRAWEIERNTGVDVQAIREAKKC